MNTTKTVSYDAIGDIICALNHIDQAQSAFPRGSAPWIALGSIYRLLDHLDIQDEQ